MTATPTATVPNKYRNDLTAGACYGQPSFTEQPLAAQYVACLGCPVRALCPEPHAARWHHDPPRIPPLARHMVAVGVPMRRARVRRCEPSAARR